MKDNKDASETASSLFYWPPLCNKEKKALENHVKRVLLACLLNQGNYHDGLNWLDIYDMELHDIYRKIDRIQRL